MNKFYIAVLNIVKGGARSFARYPLSMISALVIAVTASILIQLESVYNEKLFSSLQMAFSLGAISGMVLAAAAFRRKGFSAGFWLANLGGIILTAAVFLAVYLPAGNISEIAGARIVAGTAISFLLFLLVVSRDEKLSDFNQAAFMSLKSLVIALIYALVILLGLYFVAFAVESLLYEEMSGKVYQHIAVWSAFIGFAFFLGNFPVFGPGQKLEDFTAARKQPSFIEILFAYVIIPLMTALSAVLFIWAIQILVIGDWPSFTQLSAIFSAYALFGIWLYIMTSHYSQGIAIWYRRLFPFAALLFLAFEAYAIYDRIRLEGLKTVEYFVGITWLFAVIGTILLIFLPVVRNKALAWLAIVLIALIVMPVAGYQDLPALAQAARLKNVLQANNMLVGDRIERAPAGISQEDRQVITDATNFILRNEEAKKPSWFTQSITNPMQFESVYGFNPDYEDGSPVDVPRFRSIYLVLPQGTLHLDEYTVVLHLQSWGYNPEQPLLIETERGEYRIKFKDNLNGLEPGFELIFNGQNLLSQDLRPYLQDLAAKYKDIYSQAGDKIELADMVYKTSVGDVSLMLVFSSIEIMTSDIITWQYTYSISSIYLAD